MPDPYTPVNAEETELWHVYKSPYFPTSFNPVANGRFAARAANPSRAMLYAGNTSDCALWETVLRDVVPQSYPPHGVVIPPVAGYHITRLRLKCSTSIVDLAPLGVRRAVGDRKRRDRIAVLAAVPKYSATHGEAVKLLTEFPQAAGLSWISRQTGDAAYVFYEPPLSSEVSRSLRASNWSHLGERGLSKVRWREPACICSTLYLWLRNSGQNYRQTWSDIRKEALVKVETRIKQS